MSTIYPVQMYCGDLNIAMLSVSVVFSPSKRKGLLPHSNKVSARVRLTFYENLMIEHEKFLLSALTMSVLSGLNIEKVYGIRKAQRKRFVIMRFLCKGQRKLSVVLRCPYYTVSINEVLLYLKMVRWRCSDDEL